MHTTDSLQKKSQKHFWNMIDGQSPVGIQKMHSGFDMTFLKGKVQTLWLSIIPVFLPNQ